MRPLLVAFVATLIAASGCTVQQDVCLDLTQRLQECGLVVTEPNCDALDSATMAGILDAMEDDCSAPELVEDGAVSPELCDFAGWPCPGPIGPEPTSLPTRNTLVFVGGIDNTPAFDWSPAILDAVSNVHDAHHVPLKSWGTPDERTRDLYAALEGLSAGRPDRRFNLICYAVGGRDCRYLVSPGGLFADDPAALAAIQAKIASITTISTPHRGTRLAEAALLAVMGKIDGSILDALNLGPLAGMGLDLSPMIVAVLQGLTPTTSLSFNEQVVDAPGIPFWSYASVSDFPIPEEDDGEIAEACGAVYGGLERRDVLNPILWVPSTFAHESFDETGHVSRGPADGQVAVASARWGELKGCLPADHWDVIGQIAHVVRDPMTGFSAPRFYLQLADELRNAGW